MGDQDEQFKEQLSSQLGPAELNLDDLVFKTMPKNMDKKTTAPSQPKQAAPTPVVAPMPKLQDIKPIPATPLTEIKPIKGPEAAEVAKAPTTNPYEHTTLGGAPTHDLASDFGMELSQEKTGHKGLIISIIFLLLILGGGYYAYAKGIIKNPFAKKEETTNTGLPQGAISEIPSEWLQKYFGTSSCADQNVCGDKGDPDKDGLTNLDEYNDQTDPNSADSDGDLVADGDEKNIFGFDPTSSHTSGNVAFTDGADVKSKWNAAQKRKFTEEELKTIADKIKEFGLHEPTIGLLGAEGVNAYTNFVAQVNNINENTEAPKEGALDRDTQRYNTINKISFALIKYKDVNKSYPNVTNYADMISQIRPLLTAQAINTTDPINTEPYTYKYKAVSGGANFQLSYFSETTNQAVLINEAAALKAYASDQSVQRDTKRKADLEQISGALELYSNDHVDSPDLDAQIYPSKELWKSALEEKYITKVPLDPKTNADYAYTVSSDNSSFAIQAILENPPSDKTGYLCTPDGCDFY